MSIQERELPLESWFIICGESFCVSIEYPGEADVWVADIYIVCEVRILIAEIKIKKQGVRLFFEDIIYNRDMTVGEMGDVMVRAHESLSRMLSDLSTKSVDKSVFG